MPKKFYDNAIFWTDICFKYISQTERENVRYQLAKKLNVQQVYSKMTLWRQFDSNLQSPLGFLNTNPWGVDASLVQFSLQRSKILTLRQSKNYIKWKLFYNLRAENIIRCDTNLSTIAELPPQQSFYCSIQVGTVINVCRRLIKKIFCFHKLKNVFCFYNNKSILIEMILNYKKLQFHITVDKSWWN